MSDYGMEIFGDIIVALRTKLMQLDIAIASL